MRIQLYHYVVIGVIVVFLCNMAISYYHAWEMYSSIGDFPHFLAHVAVVAFDTVFALATLVISIGTLKKIDLGVRVWIAFIFGFIITTWSNIRASMGSEWINFVTFQWGKISPTGWESLLAGLSTPAALVAIELLLSWMVTHREKFTTSEAGETGDTQSHTKESHTLTHTNDSHTLTHDESHNDSHTESHTQESHTQNSHEVSHTRSHNSHTQESHEASHTQSHEVSHAGSHTHSHKEAREDSRVSESHTDSHTQDSHKEESDKESHTNSHKEESHTDTQSHESRDPREVAREIAREHYKKHGELPTIRGLAAKAGCGEWDARVARNDVKKEFGIVEEKKTRKKRAAAH